MRLLTTIKGDENVGVLRRALTQTVAAFADGA
jgi:hypothetical protein